MFNFWRSTTASSSPVCWCRVGGTREGDPDSNIQTIVPATARNPRNAVTSIQIHDAEINNQTGYPILPIQVGRLWAPGDNVKIGFLDGDEWQRSKVKTIAPEWMLYANLSFTFPAQKPYDVLVSFDPKEANSSVIGSDSHAIASTGKATMFLGSVQKSTADAVVKGIILHEFGHAMGATHVLDVPISDLQWDKAAVYKDLAAGELKWSQADVDKRLFKAYPGQRTHDFGDRKSIMQLALPSSWTINKKYSPWNFTISSTDMRIMRWYYPRDNEYDAGQFQSMEFRSFENPQGVTTKTVDILPDPNNATRRIIYGLNSFDLDNEQNLRLKCSISEQKEDSFTLKMESWSDSTNYFSGLTYLELKDKFSYAQAGEFSTSDVRRWDDPKLENSKRVTFATPFSKAPKIICWLTGFDFANSKNIRIKTYATDIDAKGFTIHVDSWSDTVMYLGNAQWLAVPADRKDIAVGSFNTLDTREYQNVKWDDTKQVAFENQFPTPPKMFLAINFLDLSKEGTYCCRVAMEDINVDYFKWHMQSWWSTQMYAAGASYFAYT